MKIKKIKLLLPTSAVALSSIVTVVSCGNDLFSKTYDNTVVKYAIPTGISTWSHPHTIEAIDGYVITQIFDPLIIPNRYEEYEGALVDSWISNERGNEWYFRIKDEETVNSHKTNDEKGGTLPYWTKVAKCKNPERGERIGAADFYNLFRYLYNPYNQASGGELVIKQFKNGSAIADFLRIMISDETDQNKDLLEIEINFMDHNFKIKDLFNSKAELFNDDKDKVWNKWLQNTAMDSLIMELNITDYNKVDEILKHNPSSLKSFFNKALKKLESEMKKIGITVTDTNKKFNGNNIGNFPTNWNKVIKDTFEKGKIISGSFDLDSTIETDIVQKKDKSKIDKYKYNLKFNLDVDAATFFESILCYITFSPMPSFSVDYSKNKSGYDFSLLNPLEDEMWYCGAYYVSYYNPSIGLQLRQNPYYYSAKKTKIKKIVYNIISNLSEDKKRMLLESGDLSQLILSPSDAYGWTKYIGDNNVVTSETFASEAVHKIDKPSIRSAFLQMNFSNFKDKTKKTELKESSQALVLKSVRTLMNYFFDRSQFVKCYTKFLDDPNNLNILENDEEESSTAQPISSLLRNTFNPKGFAKYTEKTDSGEKTFDYVDNYLKEEYYKNIDKNIELLGLKEEKDLLNYYSKYNLYREEAKRYDENDKVLSDGTDVFLKNDLLILNMLKDGYFENEFNDSKKHFDDFKKAMSSFAKAISNKNWDEVKSLNTEKEKILIDYVRKDMQKHGLSEVVKLKWVMTGIFKMTANPYIKYMIEDFNKWINGSNNFDQAKGPIFIEPLETTDKVDFSKALQDGEFDIAIGNWSPDFSDVSDYLFQITTGGAYEIHRHVKWILDKTSDGKLKLKNKVSETIKNENMKKEYDNFANFMQYFDSKEKESSKLTSYDSRFSSYAELENSLLYNSSLIIPLYTEELYSHPNITLIDQFTLPKSTSGINEFRVFGIELLEKFRNNEEYFRDKELYNKKDPKFYDEKGTMFRYFYKCKDFFIKE